MIEFFKHTFGLCGEGHPNFLYVLGVMPFMVFFRFIKFKVLLGLKNFLKRFYLYFSRN